ncbi:MAG TPA: ATP-binding domain-containing protein [Candidatus Binatia bacterium]
MPHEVVEEELALLKRVNELLAGTAPASAPKEESLVRELEHLRAQLREAKAEDQPAILQQWDRQTALLQKLRSTERAPEVELASPYFAHLRLREGRVEHDILLGKTPRMLPGVPIVDWRNAPISKIFYRYRQGEEYEEEIAGRTRSGEVAVRRVVAIRNGKLVRVEAPEGVFRADEEAPDGWRRVESEPPRLAGGAGAALRAHDVKPNEHGHLRSEPPTLARRADKHLADIAGLIDPDQFDLITRPASGFLVIRGTAGSGKTTVALHRIAYLAYEDPAIDSSETMVVVFSPALRDYVSHVLPALQVNKVQVRTFGEWARDQVQRLFPLLPRDVREITPATVLRMKFHPAMLKALEQQVERVPGRGAAEQALDDWASVLANQELLEEVFEREAPGAFSKDDIARVVAYNRSRNEELAGWRAGDLESGAELDEADLPLLLRAWQLRVGPLPGPGGRPLRYRHLAIDEVQDFSPLEVQVLLGCLAKDGSITLAGDTQQHIVQEGGFTSWMDFLGQLGISGVEVSTLRVSYRCTAEIARFAVELLGDLREDEEPPVTVRSGPPVELLRFTAHGACVAYLADALKELAEAEPLASVAILTPTRELSRLYATGLANGEVPRVRQVENQDFRFTPGVEVTEIEQVKGLEFDYVVLVETSASHFPDTPAARRRLHVGATRAVHQLWLTSVGTPSPLVRALLGERD